MGTSTPKVFVPLAGRPMILRTLDKFASSDRVAEVVLVVAASEVTRCQSLLKEEPVLGRYRWLLQSGGPTRQQSVRNGLQRLSTECDVVLIHDGDRPFVPTNLIERCAETAFERGAVATGLPTRDTIKVVRRDDFIETTLDRTSLWETQTPQGFRRELIEKAHDNAARNGVEGTDDAMLLECMGVPVYMIYGDRMNFKITVPEDVALAEALIHEGRVS